MKRDDIDVSAMIAEPLLTFRSHHCDYAIPVTIVRYITSDLEGGCTIHGKNQQRRVIQFDGKPVDVTPFSQLIGIPSRLEQLSKLIETLQQRRQDHIDWLDSLEEALRNATTFSKSTDPNLCAFGRWYNNFTSEDELLSDILKRFDAPHKAIHGCATQLLELSQTHQKQEALRLLELQRNSTLQSLLRLFDDACQRIKDMIKPITIILEVEERVFALDLDEISDINEYSLDDVVSSNDVNIPNNPMICAYLSKSGKPLHLLLSPLALMQQTQRQC
jgi:hypothetical protein